MIQRMFVTLDTKKTNYKNVGKINHGDDLILELTVLSDGDMISFNDPMVDFLVKKSDGKMIRQNSGIEHIKPNKFIIEVKKDCVTSPGLSTNQLIINDNGRISTCMFYYTILNSLEEDIIESISNVEVLEQLDEFTIQMKDKMENFDEELQNRMSELEDAIDDLVEFFGDTSVDLLEAELSRNEAEQSRAQAESVRVQNENRRLQNDLDLANAEAERVRAENIRIQNEADRALVDAVMDQKESEREDSELERIQNESKRATDELVRQQNESVRQSNESIRMSNETDRKTQENRRVNAETNRVNAETTRRNNENSRISNEIERQKAMNEMKSLIGNVNDFDERVGVIEDEIEEINSSLDNITDNKYDDVVLSGNELKLKANGLVKKTVTLSNTVGNSETKYSGLSYIPGIFSNYANNIVSKKLRDTVSGTSYYLTYIPNKDIDGTQIKMFNGFSGETFNNGDAWTTSQFAKSVDASVCINSGVFNTSTLTNEGTYIKDGVVLQNEIFANHWILAWKDDNSMNSFPANKPTSEILSEGYNNAVTGFIPIIMNGEKVDDSIIRICPHAWEKHPRQLIAQMPNKDIIIFACDGRLENEVGMDMNDCIRILQELNVYFAYNLDGGGSKSTILKNKKIDPFIDGSGTVERKVPSYLYFNREKTYENLYDNETMLLVNDINTRLINYINDIPTLMIRDNNGDLRKIVVDENDNLILEGGVYIPPTAELDIVQDSLEYRLTEKVETTGEVDNYYDTQYLINTAKPFTLFFKFYNSARTCTVSGINVQFYTNTLSYRSSGQVSISCRVNNVFCNNINEYLPKFNTVVTIYVIYDGVSVKFCDSKKNVFAYKDIVMETATQTIKLGCEIGANYENGGLPWRFHQTTFYGILGYNRALTQEEITRNLAALEKLPVD